MKTRLGGSPSKDAPLSGERYCPFRHSSGPGVWTAAENNRGMRDGCGKESMKIYENYRFTCVSSR